MRLRHIASCTVLKPTPSSTVSYTSIVPLVFFSGVSLRKKAGKYLRKSTWEPVTSAEMPTSGIRKMSLVARKRGAASITPLGRPSTRLLLDLAVVSSLNVTNCKFISRADTVLDATTHLICYIRCDTVDLWV